MKLTTNITRIILSIISILTGFFCIFYSFNMFKLNIYLLVTACLIPIVILELNGVFFLNRSFKMIFIRKYENFVFFFIVALLLYSASFFLSVNGIEKFVENNLNETEIIETEIEIKKDTLINYYNKTLNQSYKDLSKLNNTKITWTNRHFLQNETERLHKQIDKIQELKEKKINQLEKEKSAKIATNFKKVAFAKRNYYFATVIILLSILIFNFVYNFLNSKKLHIEKTNLQSAKEVYEYKKDLKTYKIVKKLYDSGKTQKEISELFNTNISNISRLLKKYK